MPANLIEHMVDASVAELGSAAEASTVSELCELGLRLWATSGGLGDGSDSVVVPPGVSGLQVNICPTPAPGPQGRDAVAHAWDYVSRVISALPANVPMVPHLFSLGDMADAMSPSQVLNLCVSLDSLAQAANIPAIRIRLADALDARRGDRLVLDLLPQIVATTTHLCGDVRCGDGSGRVSRAAIDRLVSVASRADPSGGPSARAPLGVSLTGPAPRTARVQVHPVGAVLGAAAAVLARAWTGWIADTAGVRSGLVFSAGSELPVFDIPDTRNQAAFSEGGPQTFWL